MLALEAAQATVLERTRPLEVEALPLAALASQHGRYASESVRAAHALPPFDNSAMDGYAVRAEDLRSASATAPVRLICLEEVPAGRVASQSLVAGSCARVYTGSPVPQGCDAVVMQEDVAVDRNQIEFREPIPPWENIRLRGEDVAADAPILARGDPISPSALALLASCGCDQVRVSRAPKVTILATGSELRPLGATLEPGQIHESNSLMLEAMIRAVGGHVVARANTVDTLAATKDAILAALEAADCLMTSGGVSVGDHDHVRSALRALGGEVALWRIALKPGKPFMYGELRGKPVFGLPGNPVSAFVTFLLLVRPALLRMLGAADCLLPVLPGTLQGRVANRGDRRHFVRVALDAQGRVHPAGAQASHRIGDLARANALLDVPPETTWEAGRAVQVLLWQLPAGLPRVV